MRALILAAALLAAPLQAEEIVPGDSTLGFAVMLGERRLEGRFEDWSAVIDAEAGTVEVVVEMGSATTGERLLDAVMLGADWLAPGAHPRAVFRSDDVTGEGAERVARGTLRIAGTDLPMAVTIRETAPRRYEARATLDRRAAGIGPEGPPVGHAVEIAATVTVAP